MGVLISVAVHALIPAPAPGARSDPATTSRYRGRPGSRAQAIYLHTGAGEVALAEATKDSALALDGGGRPYGW
ncbi:MAG: hypothetical protein ACRDTA_18290 [Pseudonocardiaceae bacterium]